MNGFLATLAITAVIGLAAAAASGVLFPAPHPFRRWPCTTAATTASTTTATRPTRNPAPKAATADPFAGIPPAEWWTPAADSYPYGDPPPRPEPPPEDVTLPDLFCGGRPFLDLPHLDRVQLELVHGGAE